MDIGEAFVPDFTDMLEIPWASEPPRSNAVAAAIGRQIYIIGGSHEGELWLRNVIRLDLDTLTYAEVPSLTYFLCILCVSLALCVTFVFVLSDVVTL